MKKIIFGIFAHPDDEAFGPSGTLLREVKNGAELHLITLTGGENGNNPDNHPNLQTVRLAEWRDAGQLIGASGMHHLGFIDGELNNIAMLRAVEKIGKIVRSVIDNQTTSVEIELISMDLNGITGHIDHIVASRAAHHVFYQLKDEGLPLTRLRLSCTPREHTGDTTNYSFVFMEPGRTPDEIDEIVDNRAYIDEIYTIMRTHHSQRADCESHINTHAEHVAINYFITKT